MPIACRFTRRCATHGAGCRPVAAATPELGLISIETDAGITGHSFLGASFRSARLDVLSLTRHLKSAVIGQDPLERERIWQALSKRIRATTYRCIGAIDVALWDIAGKVADLPIHQMLGTCRRKVPAYVSSSVLASHQAYLEQAAARCAEVSMPPEAMLTVPGARLASATRSATLLACKPVGTTTTSGTRDTWEIGSRSRRVW